MEWERCDRVEKDQGKEGAGCGEGDALLLASLLAVEPVFWTFSEIWLPRSLWGKCVSIAFRRRKGRGGEKGSVGG